MRYIIFKVFFIALFSSTYSYAQRLEYRLGELLITTPTDVTSAELTSSLLKSSNAVVDLEKIVITPIAIWKVHFDPNKVNAFQLKSQFAKNKWVGAVQFNHLLAYRNTPNDPLFNLQWSLENIGQYGGLMGADIDALQAWDITTGGKAFNGDDIVVCVIDDGSELNHPDLTDNIWINQAEIAGNGVDDDMNGYIDDVRGWNAENNSPNVDFNASHGTAVCGIVGARGNNNTGISGINWNVKIMFVQGGGDEADALAAYAYPYTMRKMYNESNGQKGALVVATNSSWGTDFGQASEAPIWCSFYDSLGEQGILNCTSTANLDINVDEDGDLPTTCPSTYLMAVTNIDRRDAKVSEAGYGKKHIDIGAYGDETYSLRLEGKYGSFGGTSASSPHVAGAVGLAYAVACQNLSGDLISKPAETALLIKNIILGAATPINSLDGITVTGGKLNLLKTLQYVQDACSDCPTSFDARYETVEKNAITVNWKTNGLAISWNLRYKLTNQSTWNTISNINPPFRIAGLSSCSLYDIEIQSNCSSLKSEFYALPTVETDGCCRVPEDFEAESRADKSIQFDWSAITSAISYRLEYKLSNQSAWTVVNLTTNSYTLTNTADCSVYLARLKVNCQGLETPYTSVVTIRTNCGDCLSDKYCLAGNPDNSFEWIEAISIGSITNVSNKDNNGYGNYTGMFDINMEIGKSYPFSITPGIQQSTFTENVAGWIDWNHDFIFSQSEKIFDKKEIPSKFDTTILVPANAIPGVTRLRTVLIFSRTVDGCGQPNFNFGEYEDYCVNIIDASNVCNENLNPKVASKSENGVVISWDNFDQAITFNTRLKREDSNDWMYKSVIEPQVSYADLDTCVNYEFQIKTVCANSTTEYSPVLPFRSLCTTAVNDEDEQFIADLYPNPCSEYFYIKWGKDVVVGDAMVSIFNQTGQMISQPSILSPIQGELSQLMDMTAYAKGIYFVSLQIGEKRYIQKLVKI